MQNRTDKVKLVAGRVMRAPMATAAEAAEINGDPIKLMRHAIERGVAAGLAYRDSEDVQVPLDIAEARSLVREYRLARQARLSEELAAADDLARYVEGLASQAALAFGEPMENGK